MTTCSQCEESRPLRWVLTGGTLFEAFCGVRCLQHYLIDHADNLDDLDCQMEAAAHRTAS